MKNGNEMAIRGSKIGIEGWKLRLFEPGYQVQTKISCDSEKKENGGFQIDEKCQTIDRNS